MSTHRTPEKTRALPRLALTSCEAPIALGVSDDFFRRHVAHQLRWVRLGNKKLVSLSELQAFLDREARLTVEPTQ